MQACMNEAADLVALVAKLKEEHSKALEERDMKHGAELSKLSEQITNLNGSLDAIAKQNKEQHAQLREAEEKLAAHVNDMAAPMITSLVSHPTCRKHVLDCSCRVFFLTLCVFPLLQPQRTWRTQKALPPA